MKTYPILFCLAVLTLSCGKSGGGSSNGESKVSLLEEKSGQFEAYLRPMNTKLNGFITSGKASISLDKNVLDVKLVMDDAPRVVHMQAIQLEGECPGMSADKNGDGIIDGVEAQNATGAILVPLDGDLNSQRSGIDKYPSGSSYSFAKRGSTDSLIQDLRSPDEDVQDYIVKLSPEDNFRLSGKVIFVYGVYENTPLPATVAAFKDKTPAMSIPIACGKIQLL